MESDEGVDQGSVPDVQGRPHSKRDVALAAEEAFAINGQYPNVPHGFLNYISDRRLVTQKIYRHDIEQFLGFVERETKQPGRLEEVWNWNLCHRFLKIVKAIYAPSTACNYLAALKAARDYLEFEGRCPANYREINDRFQKLTKTGTKAKNNYQRQIKHTRLDNTDHLLEDLFNKIYHSVSLWSQYNGIVAEVKAALKAKKPVRRLTRFEYTFVIGFVAWLLLLLNLKRSGNLCLLELKSVAAALNSALATFMAKNKGVDISKLPRKLDQSILIPAVFEVAESTKKMEVEYFCVSNPRDQRALLEFVEYLRDNGPTEPKSTKFLINSKGHKLDKVTPYLQAITNAVNIPEVTVMKLRSLIETENFCEEQQAEVSEHLGHNKQNTMIYYFSPRKRHAVSAHFRILSMFQRSGEKEYVSPTKTLWDPVSITISLLSVSFS